MPAVTEARLVAGERDGSMVVAAASKATAANAEMIIPPETGVSARLAARFNRAKRAFEAGIFSGGERTCPSQRPLRRWIGVDPGELYFRCGRIDQLVPHPAPADSDRLALSHQPGT